jgi:periplasmic copper chaperone A
MIVRAIPVFRLGLVAAASVTTAACTPRSAPPAPPRVVVANSWARIADSGATSGAYLEIRNNDTVAITLVSVATNDAGAAEVHESMQLRGMARMMPRPSLLIAPAEVVIMAPGGVHVMLVGLHRALAVGDSVRLQLHFSDSTTVPVAVPVLTP